MKKFLLLLVALVSCCSLWADDKVDTSIPVTTEVKDKTFVLVFFIYCACVYINKVYLPIGL